MQLASKGLDNEGSEILSNKLFVCSLADMIAVLLIPVWMSLTQLESNSDMDATFVVPPYVSDPLDYKATQKIDQASNPWMSDFIP